MEYNVLELAVEGALSEAVTICTEHADMERTEAAEEVLRAARVYAVELLASSTEKLSAGLNELSGDELTMQTVKLALSHFLGDALELADVENVVNLSEQVSKHKANAAN
jgi:hypothetical protein